MNRHRDLMALRDRFRSRLRELSSNRHLRTGLVRTASGHTEIEWALHERAQMLVAVNEVRTERGLSPVSLSDVERADRLATGLIDWFEKFSFSCAELAIGVLGTGGTGGGRS